MFSTFPNKEQQSAAATGTDCATGLTLSLGLDWDKAPAMILADKTGELYLSGHDDSVTQSPIS